MFQFFNYDKYDKCKYSHAEMIEKCNSCIVLSPYSLSSSTNYLLLFLFFILFNAVCIHYSLFIFTYSFIYFHLFYFIFNINIKGHNISCKSLEQKCVFMTSCIQGKIMFKMEGKLKILADLVICIPL